MRTPRRRSVPLRRSLVHSLRAGSGSSRGLRQSLDHWGGSPLIWLLLLLALGYVSVSLFPQSELSCVLALAGGSLFCLALLGALWAGELRARRLASWGLRLGLACLLVLGARLYRAERLRRQLDEAPWRAEVLWARLEASHELEAGRRSYELTLLGSPATRLALRHATLPATEVGDTLVLRGVRWRGLREIQAQAPRWGRSLQAGGYSAVGEGGQVVSLRVRDRELWAHPGRLSLRWQGRLLSRLEGLELSPTTRHLLGALTLGELSRDEGGRRLRQAFVGGGVAHLLAVSGFHLGVIVGVVLGLLRCLAGGERWWALRWGLVLSLAWLFTGLTGASVPTLRAVGMLTLYALARGLGRRACFPEVLALPAVVQLLWMPESLWGASFLLTYGAMVGIYLFFRPLYGGLGELRTLAGRYLWAGLALTLATAPVVLPLSWYLFGRVSLSFLWTNLLAVPLASLLILLGGVLFLLLACGQVAPPVLLGSLEGLSRLLEGSVRWSEGVKCLQGQAELPLAGLVGYLLVLVLLRLGWRWMVGRWSFATSLGGEGEGWGRGQQ